MMQRCDDALVRTTLTIDDDVLSVARALAEQRSVSLGAAVSELARRGFRRGPNFVREGGVPVFRVDPDARPITNEDVYEALSDWP